MNTGKIIEHTFTRDKQHLTREVPPEELAQLNRVLTVQRKQGDPKPSVATTGATPPSGPSPAAARREAMRAAYEEKTGLSPDTRIVARKITVGGKMEEWYFLQLEWTDLSVIGEQISRDMRKLRQKKFDLTKKEILRIATAALLTHAVVCGPNDESPYFSESEAFAYGGDPATMELTARLFHIINEINPDALPKSSGDSRKTAA